MRTRLISTLASLSLAACLHGASFAAPPKAAKTPPPDKSAQRVSGSENYVPTFGLRASVSRGFKVHGVLSVDAGLDVPESKDRKRVTAIRPRLFSAMRDSVLNYASSSYLVGERPNADLLRSRLQKTVDNELGKGKARVVLASVMVFDK